MMKHSLHIILALAVLSFISGCRDNAVEPAPASYPETAPETYYDALANICPVIGISATDTEESTSAFNTYLEAILNSGGIPVILPRIADREKLYELVAILDGLLLTGGDDIDPKLYNEKLSPLIENIESLRDEHELALVKLAYDFNLPTMGICRGLQMINVAFGGTLYQDIPSEYSDKSIQHRRLHPEDPAPRHIVKALEGSTYASVVGDKVDDAYSSHHQGIKKIAPLFRAVGWSNDGFVEAIEAYPYHPILAVQYHPERTMDNEASVRLFRHFLAKAATYHRAKEIHENILSVDTHTDTPLAFLKGYSIGTPSPRMQVSIRKMQQGHLDSQFLAAWLAQEQNDEASLKGAVAKADKLIDLIYADVAKYPEDCGIATGTDDLKRLKAEGKKAFFIGIENGYAIGNDLGNIERFYKRGVRYITLCHSQGNLICHSSRKNEDGGSGLTDFGRDVVKEMNRVGMIIDLSHADDETFYQVLELSSDPVVCTHSSSRALCNHNRDVSDEMIKAIADKGGVIQVCLVDNFTNDDESKASIIDVVNHIEHIIEVGGIDCVGIGSDFDGGGGVLGCNGDNDLINITVALLERGYSGEDIRKIWGGNFFRVMDAVCK